MNDPITNESYEPLFNDIAQFLGVNLLVVSRNTGNQYFSLEAKSRESISLITNYFNLKKKKVPGIEKKKKIKTNY